MAKINFTASRVEAFQCASGKSQEFLWDSKTPGLGLRATLSGAKAYIYQGKIHGRTVRLTIGDPRSWSIDKAQEEARRLQTLVDTGIDPREHRVEQQAAYEARKVEEYRKDVTFGEAWDKYVESRKPFWSERHYNDHLLHADVGGKPKKRGVGLTQSGPLATLRCVKLPDLSSEMIAAWLLGQSQERPTMAALSYRLLRAFVRWAAEAKAYQGIISTDVYKARDVRDAVPRVRPKDGDCLQREQLTAWFAAVRSIPNLVHSVYLQGLLILGPRREEWAGVRWDDLDLQWRGVTLDDKVEGTGGRTIPLSPYMLDLLLKLKEINETPPDKRRIASLAARGEVWKPSPWVFSSLTSADGKLSEPRIAHVKALHAAGLPHVTLHGLRRSFGTLAEWCEVPVGVVAQIQGHKPSAIAEKHYRRRPLDLLRMWHDKIEEWMLKEAGVEFVPEHISG
ncbi:integrase family protein [Herbaspirillum sp. RV1423]|uniref:tyrosine-type recombinase/integrase n=1 Tax=Herbaspirillum sp. RV1423 TaxID=1443993 RepID=UPI00054CF0E1|nr:integrase family protein [Herbaspirillum sp. RV1423]